MFFDDANELIPDTRWGWKPGTLVVPNEGRVFLRLYPTATVTPFETELDAESALRTGGLRPMGRISSWGPERNVYGGIVYDSPKDNGVLYHFTQLFLTREIWAVDALCLNASRCREFNQEFQRTLDRVYIASGYLTEVFLEALHNYIAFAKNTLRLPLPLQIKAGLVGVKDYRIAIGNSICGLVLQDVVEWHTELFSYETATHEIAASFFAKVWKGAGIPWTTADTQALSVYSKQRGY